MTVKKTAQISLACLHVITTDDAATIAELERAHSRGRMVKCPICRKLVDVSQVVITDNTHLISDWHGQN